MLILTFISLALATWRVSNMLADVRQEGPFHLLTKLRLIAGMRYNELSEPYGSTNFSQGLLCVYCNSIWVGLAFMALLYFFPTTAFWVSIPFALSGIAILIENRKG